MPRILKYDDGDDIGECAGVPTALTEEAEEVSSTTVTAAASTASAPTATATPPTTLTSSPSTGTHDRAATRHTDHTDDETSSSSTESDDESLALIHYRNARREYESLRKKCDSLDKKLKSATTEGKIKTYTEALAMAITARAEKHQEMQALRPSSMRGKQRQTTRKRMSDPQYSATRRAKVNAAERQRMTNPEYRAQRYAQMLARQSARLTTKSEEQLEEDRAASRKSKAKHEAKKKADPVSYRKHRDQDNARRKKAALRNMLILGKSSLSPDVAGGGSARSSVPVGRSDSAAAYRVDHNTSPPAIEVSAGGMRVDGVSTTSSPTAPLAIPTSTASSTTLPSGSLGRGYTARATTASNTRARLTATVQTASTAASHRALQILPIPPRAPKRTHDDSVADHDSPLLKMPRTPASHSIGARAALPDGVTTAAMLPVMLAPAEMQTALEAAMMQVATSIAQSAVAAFTSAVATTAASTLAQMQQITQTALIATQEAAAAAKEANATIAAVREASAAEISRMIAIRKADECTATEATSRLAIEQECMEAVAATRVATAEGAAHIATAERSQLMATETSARVTLVQQAEAVIAAIEADIEAMKAEEQRKQEEKDVLSALLADPWEAPEASRILQTPPACAMNDAETHGNEGRSAGLFFMAPHHQLPIQPTASKETQAVIKVLQQRKPG
jgi:hypothetical protein